jgi:chloride channel 3/4/5
MQLRRILWAGQTWFVITLVGRCRSYLCCVSARIDGALYTVGICIGLNAAIISITTEWLSDIKMGYCSDGWWLNRASQLHYGLYCIAKDPCLEQFCCWEVEEDASDAQGYGCESWHPWSTYTFTRWIIYIIFAVGFPLLDHILPEIHSTFRQTSFAFISAHLVRSLAKYAAGSGISEIKCILAGFVMHGFLGFWTLAIKSITLVSLYACCLYLRLLLYASPGKIAFGDCLWTQRWQGGAFSARRVCNWQFNCWVIRAIHKKSRFVSTCA